MILIDEYRGYLICATTSGGKAGKGHNVTASVQVRKRVGKGHQIVKTFRYKVGTKPLSDRHAAIVLAFDYINTLPEVRNLF